MEEYNPDGSKSILSPDAGSEKNSGAVAVDGLEVSDRAKDSEPKDQMLTAEEWADLQAISWADLGPGVGVKTYQEIEKRARSLGLWTTA